MRNYKVIFVKGDKKDSYTMFSIVGFSLSLAELIREGCSILNICAVDNEIVSALTKKEENKINFFLSTEGIKIA